MGQQRYSRKKKKGKVAGKLTSQQLTSRLDNTNEKGVALLQMYNLSGQTRHLILEYRYLLHKAARFAGVINSHLRLAFSQTQTAFEICNPGGILIASANRTRRQQNSGVESFDRR
jgi:hypothetical protein